MTYRDMFSGDLYQNEFDEEMTRKHGYNYKALKHFYPQAWQLPESEIKTMIRILYDKGKTIEDARPYLDSYIKENEPKWNLQSTDSLVQTPELPTAMKITKVKPPRTDLNAENSNERIINAFYEHLKNPDIEGEYYYPYCDSVGISTGGRGLAFQTRRSLDDVTMTLKNASVSVDNPALTPVQKDEWWRKHRQYCNSFYRGKDTEGKDVWNVPSAENQLKGYRKFHNETLPFFHENELEAKTKNYIEKQVLNPLVEKLKRHNIDFYNRYNLNGQIGLMDIPYNVGGDKFRLCTDVNDKKCWPKFTTGLVNDDMEYAAEESHRKGIPKARNDMIYNYIKNGLRE